MNIFAFCATATAVCFKLANELDGVSPMEFLLWRSAISLIGILLPLHCLKISPITGTQGRLPLLILRAMTGQAAFCIFTFSLSIIPLSLQMVLF